MVAQAEPRINRELKQMRTTWRSLALILIALAAAASWGCQDKINFLKARSRLNSGVKAFEASDFPIAAAHFEEAIELEPALTDAMTFRACSYMMQYNPGDQSAENKRIANEAIAGFQEVLKRDPDNKVAKEYIASLYYNMKEFDKSKQAYAEVLAADPNHKVAHYTFGVINWAIAYPKNMELRAELGMKPEDPGPFPNAKAREALAQENEALIDEGLRHLEEAVKIDPLYDDAMAYMNLLYRQKADIADTKEEYEQYISSAEDWNDKVLLARKTKAEAGTQEAF
jgi:tetratricopeptide (TPR) repeat protein